MFTTPVTMLFITRGLCLPYLRPTSPPFVTAPMILFQIFCGVCVTMFTIAVSIVFITSFGFAYHVRAPRRYFFVTAPMMQFQIFCGVCVTMFTIAVSMVFITFGFCFTMFAPHVATLFTAPMIQFQILQAFLFHNGYNVRKHCVHYLFAFCLAYLRAHVATPGNCIYDAIPDFLRQPFTTLITFATNSSITVPPFSCIRAPHLRQFCCLCRLRLPPRSGRAALPAL